MSGVGKPLYLQASVASPMVVLLDGPALRVTQPMRADGRYPLRLVNRIFSSGPVEWKSAVLLHVMEQGITITFQGADKNRVGTLLPRKVKGYECSRQLELVLDQPDGWGRFENWIASAVRRQTLRLQRRLPINLHSLRRKEISLQLQQRAEVYLSPSMISETRQQLDIWCSALVAEMLVENGVQSLNFSHLHTDGRNVDHIELFTDILYWDLEVVVYQLAKGIQRRFGKDPDSDNPRIRHLQLRAFHQSSAQLKKILAMEIANYCNWLLRESCGEGN